MSLGARARFLDEVSHYQPWQMRRLEVRPGLTRLWQISGRSRIGFEEWMRLDLEYIQPLVPTRRWIRCAPSSP
jgi:lipopolysaccharide/colanic/teichoic acid biosynthesis glycosyltransferase